MFITQGPPPRFRRKPRLGPRFQLQLASSHIPPSDKEEDWGLNTLLDALPQDEGQQRHERPELPPSDGAGPTADSASSEKQSRGPRGAEQSIQTHSQPPTVVMSHLQTTFVDNPYLGDELWVDPLAENKKQVALTSMPPLGRSQRPKQSIAYVIPRKATELPKEGE